MPAGLEAREARGHGCGASGSPGPGRERPSTHEEAFALAGVSVSRGGRRVLHDIDLEIAAGRITALIGPSGSGKTSLLRILNRLDEPEEGAVRYAGRLLPEYPVTELRRRVALVFQTPALFTGTVRDNLAEAARIGGLPVTDPENRAREVTAAAELDPALLDRDARELSIGQQQRAMLARALFNRPEALLLDEPTASLDGETSERLLRTVRRLAHDEGLTVVLATHRGDEAREIADFTVLLEGGRVVAAGGGDGARSPAAAVTQAPDASAEGG